MKPRVLFVARTRYRLPLSLTLQRRFDALSTVLEWRQFGTSLDGPPIHTDRFSLVRRLPLGPLEGASFYAALPARVVRELRSFRPDVVIVQGAQDAALTMLARAVARSDLPIVYDVHGDWRTDTRLYGSPLRRALSPVTDRVARHVVRSADGVRTVSGFTSRLVREQGVEPTATFPAYMDLAPFTATPPVALPTMPQALFVGVLERYKGVDVLADAWPSVCARVPGARLHVVGRGRLASTVEALVTEKSLGVSWTPELPTEGVAQALDESTLLVLPSRGEGMGRVLVEAFCRGRSIVGTDSGGIPDLVENGVSGFLVPPDDSDGLAAALSRVLGDAVLAQRLGSRAHAAAGRWMATPEEFAGRMRALVDTVIERRRR